ncbi:MAG: hypothetical protein A2X59_11595 [Nitrospirae bacterium GWC2_42_7]|nr:MAG: hypothetical protein A2X59_11595 [Nitrospirae bacterium GWC2_42_7]
MTTKTSELPDTKFIKSEVIDVIVKKLGITKTAFFLRETMSQKTDYLEIKKKLFEDKTAAELYKEIIRSKTNK